MQLTEKELATIVQAENSFSRVKNRQVVILVVVTLTLLAMLSGILNTDLGAYFLFAVVLYAILLPKISGPPTSDVVALLTKMRSKADIKKIDPLINVISRKA
ncbi:MAG: hypothetical protein ACI96M_002184 [Candidatus Azotimanducaceae bacterium]|jgi:hypothetical protein